MGTQHAQSYVWTPFLLNLTEIHEHSASHLHERAMVRCRRSIRRLYLVPFPYADVILILFYSFGYRP